MSKPKIKELIAPEHRISLFQTSMNNAGRNFEGKKVSVSKMADFASSFYKLAIREIENLGELSVKQMVGTVKKDETKKVASKADLKKLIGRINGAKVTPKKKRINIKKRKRGNR